MSADIIRLCAWVGGSVELRKSNERPNSITEPHPPAPPHPRSLLSRWPLPLPGARDHLLLLLLLHSRAGLASAWTSSRTNIQQSQQRGFGGEASMG